MSITISAENFNMLLSQRKPMGAVVTVIDNYVLLNTGFGFVQIFGEVVNKEEAFSIDLQGVKAKPDSNTKVLLQQNSITVTCSRQEMDIPVPKYGSLYCVNPPDTAQYPLPEQFVDLYKRTSRFTGQDVGARYTLDSVAIDEKGIYGTDGKWLCGTDCAFSSEMLAAFKEWFIAFCQAMQQSPSRYNGGGYPMPNMDDTEEHDDTEEECEDEWEAEEGFDEDECEEECDEEVEEIGEGEESENDIEAEEAEEEEEEEPCEEQCDEPDVVREQGVWYVGVPNLLVPPNVPFKKTDRVSIAFASNNRRDMPYAVFEQGNVRFYAALVVGKYPNFSNVFLGRSDPAFVLLDSEANEMMKIVDSVPKEDWVEALVFYSKNGELLLGIGNQPQQFVCYQTNIPCGMPEGVYFIASRKRLAKIFKLQGTKYVYYMDKGGMDVMDIQIDDTRICLAGLDKGNEAFGLSESQILRLRQAGVGNLHLSASEIAVGNAQVLSCF